ncbi:MAG: penicillin-binding transpeptidase domain-containing protein [Terriglobales bacterium]|jgi:hypothetical protein
MRILALLLVIVGLCLLFPGSQRAQRSTPGRSDSGMDGRSNLSSDSRGTSLFAQSTGQTLHRDFPSDDISFLLIDIPSGEVLASRWDHPEIPIAMGSLVKPFTALAYGEGHDFRYPVHICRGASTGCWHPRGHGKMDLTSAIAQSCNSYFRMLTAQMTAAEMTPFAARFGLQPPSKENSGPALAGLSNHVAADPGPDHGSDTAWLIAPLNMARAYRELIRSRYDRGVRLVLDGMAQSARQGTAADVDRALLNSVALAKTGTAPCIHARHAPGDGFTVVLFPAGHPTVLLLVRVHGVPGSQAAGIAGRMLRSIEP